MTQEEMLDSRIYVSKSKQLLEQAENFMSGQGYARGNMSNDVRDLIAMADVYARLAQALRTG